MSAAYPDPIPRPELAELIGQLARLACVWFGDDAPELGLDGGPQAWLELSLLSHRTVGGAEYRQQPTPNNPDALDSRVCSYDLAVVTIRAYSFESDVQPSAVLNRVRWGLRTWTAKAVYQRTHIAYVRVMPIVPSWTDMGEGRTRLNAAMDWQFAVRGGGIPNDDPGGTIGTVNGGGVIPVTSS